MKLSERAKEAARSEHILVLISLLPSVTDRNGIIYIDGRYLYDPFKARWFHRGKCGWKGGFKAELLRYIEGKEMNTTDTKYLESLQRDSDILQELKDNSEIPPESLEYAENKVDGLAKFQGLVDLGLPEDNLAQAYKLIKERTNAT